MKKGTITIRDAPSHVIQFPFKLAAPVAPTPIDVLLKQYTWGIFTLSGSLKWIGEPVKPEHDLK